jgi:ATP-dependent Lon protease
VIGLKHLVFFDEVSHIRFDDVEASLNMLKDFMQTGKFKRGDQEFSAQCSIVFGGNIDTDMSVMQADGRYRHLFEPLPPELQDAASLDRIHACLLGWEIPKIRPNNYATGYGFLTDYLAEIFAELRRRNFQTRVNAWIDMGSMTGRNQDAVRKTVAGMLKLLHPHRSHDSLAENEIAPLVAFAIGIRRRTTDQLAKMLPAEFSQVDFSNKLRHRG